MKAEPEACSREKSRKVRSIIREYILKEVEKREYELPDSCELDPENDMQLPQEEEKHFVSVREWRCGKCGKRFKSEEFLDKHLYRKHKDMVSEDRTVCLADLCEIFDCDSVLPNLGGANTLASLRSTCDAKKMKRLQHRCQAMLSKCFPPEQSNDAHFLQGYYDALFCSRFSCDPAKLAPQLLVPTDKDDSDEEVGLSTVLKIIAVVILFIFFLFWCVAYLDLQSNVDLQGAGTLSGFFRKKSRYAKTKDF
eukprot:c17326_g1_i3.p1 GENE.c17326_g1_i3~~c17326_g1_i3.p1  ORF type:complete len:290 (+),score=62.88 c17326_g1_i3:118-870(+)